MRFQPAPRSRQPVVVLRKGVHCGPASPRLVVSPQAFNTSFALPAVRASVRVSECNRDFLTVMGVCPLRRLLPLRKCEARSQRALEALVQGWKACEKISAGPGSPGLLRSNKTCLLRCRERPAFDRWAR